MKKSTGWWLSVFLVVLFGATPVGLVAQAQQAVVIDGGTLIDGNGGAPVPNAVVVIQGNRITSVSRRGQATIPPNSRVINGDGKFILPGLWDAQIVYQWYFPELMLNYGITSTIDVGTAGEIGPIHRDAILHGKIHGPRLFTSLSRITTNPGGNTGFETMLNPGQSPKSADDVRKFVNAFFAGGADYLIFQDGTLPLEYYQVGFDEAKRLGKPVFTRAYGPIFGPREAAMMGTRSLPHSAGIGRLVTKNPPTAADGRNELDLFSDMDDAKAKDLIQFLVQHNVALTPTYKIQYPSYPKDWARFEEEDRKLLSDPNILAYYPQEAILTQMAAYRGAGDQGAVRERRMKGFQNTMRFHKMFVDAGGKLILGANTNATKVPGQNLLQEMAIHTEAGSTPMQIIQGATKWSAEIIDKGKDLGTVEAGKIADVILVNKDPLQNVQNLRDLNTVIFDGKVQELGYHSYFSDPFLRNTPYGPPVESLAWVVAFRRATAGGGGGAGRGGVAAGALPDPVAAPNPAIETISPTVVTQGNPTATITLKGFNFVRRSQVLFKWISVPYKVVSPTELQVILDAVMLQEAGWFDLVVRNPAPIGDDAWGNGTSNKAHLVVNYKY